MLNKQVKSTDEEVELTYPPLSQPSVQLLSAQSPSCETSLSSSLSQSTSSQSTCQSTSSQSLQLTPSSSQSSLQLTSSSSKSSQSGSSCQSTSSSHDLHRVVYLLERFGISDAFYHELTMITPSLPRSYKIKEAQQKLTSVVELKKLPSPYNGSYRSIKETVVAAILSEVTC